MWQRARADPVLPDRAQAVRLVAVDVGAVCGETVNQRRAVFDSHELLRERVLVFVRKHAPRPFVWPPPTTSRMWRSNNRLRQHLPRDVLLEVLNAGEKAIPGLIGYVLNLRASVEQKHDRLT